jgi:adenosylcobinamide kinase/adenosylcobinamide-phosphate guanylyltransferase
LAKQITLLLGGARSGKSHYAQQLAAELNDRVLFVATGEALDEEMQARIAEHKKNRPKNWRTVEIPTSIGGEIERQIGNVSPFSSPTCSVASLTILTRRNESYLK